MKDIISSGQVRLTKLGKIIIGGNSDKTLTEDGIDGLVSFMNLKMMKLWEFGLKVKVMIIITRILY